MYLLDTDTLTHLHKGNLRVTERVARADAKVSTTIITRIEILRGRIEFMRKAANGAELLRAQYWLHRSEELLAQIEIVSFDDAAANLFDGLRAQSRLRKIGHEDSAIASLALSHRATLVTRNVRHFQIIPNLRVANWLD
jgi:tRNA(fMet)-specific endonuclease VapC